MINEGSNSLRREYLMSPAGSGRRDGGGEVGGGGGDEDSVASWLVPLVHYKRGVAGLSWEALLTALMT